MKPLALFLLGLGAAPLAEAKPVQVFCQQNGSQLSATLDPAAGPQGSISYHVAGKGYVYDGFVKNDPAATYAEKVSVKNGETLDLDADLYKTEIVDYQECVVFIPNSRACGGYVTGPHPHTTLSQGFFLRLDPLPEGQYKIGYFSIFNANPELPGGYEFSDLKNAVCTVSGLE